MRLTYKILRTLAVTVFALAVGLPVSLYVALSTPWVQNRIRDIGAEELGKYLGTEVNINHIAIMPFNRLALEGVTVADDYGKPALEVKDIESRFELFHFLRTGNIVIDYVSLQSPKLTLYKRTDNAPLNIARIIAKVAKRDTTKYPTRFKLAVNTVELTEGSASYDILSAMRKTSGFDAKHLHVTDITAYATLPQVSNDAVDVDLHHLSLCLNNAFRIDEIKTEVGFYKGRVSVSDVTVDLPRTHLDVKLFDLPVDFKGLGVTKPLGVILSDNTVCPADFEYFVPALKDFTRVYDLSAVINGCLSDFTVGRLMLSPHSDNDMFLNLKSKGSYVDKTLNLDELKIDIRSSAGETARLLAAVKLPADVASRISMLGDMEASADVSGVISTGRKALSGSVSVDSRLGNVAAEGSYELVSGRHEFDVHTELAGVDLGSLTGLADLGNLSANAMANGVYENGRYIGSANVDVSQLDYKNIVFDNLRANLNVESDGTVKGDVNFDNREVGAIDLALNGVYDGVLKQADVTGTITALAMSRLTGWEKYADYKLWARLNSHLQLNDKIPYGYVLCDNLKFISDNADDRSLTVRSIALQAKHDVDEDVITLSSDFINGSAHGQFNWRNLKPEFYRIAAGVLPDFINSQSALRNPDHEVNDFTYNFTIAKAENISDFFNLPVKIIYPVTVDGVFCFAERRLSAKVDAPWLQSGEKIIEATALNTEIADAKASATFHSQFPTKKGDMDMTINLSGVENRVNTAIDWMIKRDKPINGNLSFSTLLGRDLNKNLTANLHVNPGDITFGEDMWHIGDAEIRYVKNLLDVRNFTMTAPTQSLAINGLCTDAPNTHLDVDINNLNLISIFETLDINNALIGGRATGRISAGNIFDKVPHVWSEGLSVKDISYNYCVLGDALVKTAFDAVKNSFYIDADITGNHGDKSHIYGDIYTVGERLDINFDANHVEIGFMKPFMQAFAADLSGTASGCARLYGTFKDIDLEGDLYAENLGIKLDFTNTWYYATDSVHIRPGRILLEDITIRDVYGNRAKLNGFVQHTYFHSPVFEFKITDADKLLCYDVTAKKSPDWYGRIFGTGSAAVTGKPGVVDISVDMFTNENSTFTFVLSDLEEADDYTFITFRDVTPVSVEDSVVFTSKIPAEVLEYRERMRAAREQKDVPTAYNMDIKIEITPSAKLIVVMDPIGGDAIKANGNGNFRMTYASVGNDLRMYGTYTIERGSYNFTLQDIIVKDFTIREGSSITFTGDPYSARLDIDATYTVNANLSDLDESFLQDKDLNRTNVPVYAVLKATGDMRQPDIAFDLEFPTLSSDIYRKVRSIVSTDDMMNRQILYLLALNRFYTPEYMQTTKGNELFSVASSTISSQLSSILGKFSDNWSIAPNLRSDRGDFTDLEVDVALSSSLLNNRLRLNGNFGYRDKSLNTNQFIGDFDIEYILNRRGSWRLKAYNRYNDQNYYLRTATTTQGVGIVFKRDFDHMLDFMRKRNKVMNDSIPAPTLRPDTITIPKLQTQ